MQKWDLRRPTLMEKYGGMKMRRLFAGVAVEATEALRAALDGLRQELNGERIRWVRMENLHLTIEFFGETAADKIPDLAGALARAAEGAKACAINLSGLGTFGGARHPRVLWLGVVSEGLAELHARVEASLREVGWSPEVRDFVPHLTLGRIERLTDAERLAEVLGRMGGIAGVEQFVRELILYESVSGQYVPLGKWRLGLGKN